MPRETLLSVTPETGGANAVVASGRPQIKLPIIGWFWPIEIESLRLNGEKLTVGLRGWQDYEMEVK